MRICRIGPMRELAPCLDGSLQAGPAGLLDLLQTQDVFQLRQETIPTVDFHVRLRGPGVKQDVAVHVGHISAGHNPELASIRTLSIKTLFEFCANLLAASYAGSVAEDLIHRFVETC